MKVRHAAQFSLSVLVVLSLLFSGLPGLFVSPVQAATIVIDGVKDAAWGDALAVDPTGDMTEVNLDLQGLYVTDDVDYFYIGFDATASNWGMTYGVYIDTDQVDGSGATSDPWGRAVAAVSQHLPEHTLYVYHEDWDALQDVQLNHWNGTSWSYDSLISQGGAQGYGAANDWIEYAVPKAALGSPASIALEVFTTGGGGHAQDTVPSDANVAYTAPDWGGDTTILSAFAVYPPPAWFVAGDFNGWSSTADAMVDDGTNGDAVAGDGVHTAQVTVSSTGGHEFKVTNDDWSTSFPGSGNSWFETTVVDEVVTFTFDTNIYSDGWLPETNVIGVSTEPGAWTAVGDWQGWNNSNGATAMAALGGGVYQLVADVATPGSYQYKAVKTGTWSAIGADGRGVNAATASFETLEANQTVTFTVDALGGRISVEPAPVVLPPTHDDNIWWGGLEHDSRDSLYRTPFGAVPTSTPVVLRFRTYDGDVTGVKVRVWDTAQSAQTLYPMAQVATVPGNPYDFAIWELELPAPDYLTVLYYRFIVTDGADTNYYEDDDLYDGGLGETFDSSPDQSWQIDVYAPGLTTPDWFKDAVVYQIFPDRFYNGVTANDPISGTFFYDEDPGTLTAPQWNWVVPDPRVAGPWEESYSKLFYGGDLQGIIDKLDYLQGLGVNTLYLNPIFESPSNHKYDTTNYEMIDDNFGDLATFQALAAELDARGMHLVLDGVFNHTSSDSMYFDRYSRYPGVVGACEDVSSPYRDWYYFSPANPPGTGECAGDTTYTSWWGFDSLPKLNTTDEPGVRSYIYSDPAAIATYWLNQGADGWRLDVAGDVAHSFWEEWRAYILGAKSDAITIAEEWGDASQFMLGDELDSTMNYRFRNAVIGLLRDTDWIDTNSTIPALAVSEFDSLMHSIEEDYPAEVWYALMNLVGSHDTNRVLIPLDQDGDPTDTDYSDGKARLKVLALIQMTMPGAPTIYYGDEVGLVGYGDAAGGGTYYSDPYNRQPYPWPELPGYYDLPAWRQRDLDLRSTYQTLIKLRNNHPALRTGSFDTLLVDDANGLYAYGRKDVAASSALVMVVNRGTTAQDIVVDLAGYIGENSMLVDVLFGGAAYRVRNGQITVPAVAPMSGTVLAFRLGNITPPAAPLNLAAVEGNGQVALTWDAVAGAASYTVYRSYVSGGGYEVLASGVATNAFTDTAVLNGAWYYYIVTAVDSGDLESDPSNEVAALPHAPIGWAGNLEPNSIVILIGQTTPSILAQVWVDGVTNAAGQGAGVLAEVGWGPATTPYELWDTWAPMGYFGDVGNNDQYEATLTPEVRGQFRYLARFSTTLGREWTYARLPDGRIPVLTVRQSADYVPPRTPENLVVLDWGTDHVTLGWDPVTGDPSLYAYDVFRSDVSGVVGAKIGRVLAPSTVFTDTTVTSGHTYYYVIQAVDTSFNLSGYSNEVEATADPKLVDVTFRVTVPDYTPAGATVYIVGDIGEFCGWCNPQTVALTQIDPVTWERTFSLPDGQAVQYKYSRGNWDINEWWGPIVSVNNRSMTVDYGATGAQLVADTVWLWRDPLVVDHTPLDGAVDVPVADPIVVTLSRHLDPATLTADNLVLTNGVTTPTLDIAWEHQNPAPDVVMTQITMTPTVPLDSLTAYTVMLKTGLAGLASDNEGIHLQSPYSWSFTTAYVPVDVAINEVRVDQTSTDNDEYFELAGAPGTSLDGLTYLVIGDGTGGSGVIEEVTDLTGQVIPASGYFVAAEDTFTLGAADMVTDLNFENSDNVTHLLVAGFTGASSDDLDTNDDGVLDVTPWFDMLDLIALIEEENPPSGTEYHYGPPSVGPDGGYAPGHAYYCDFGWQVGAFDPVGGNDTPGAANPCVPPLPDVRLSEVRIDQTSTDNDEYVELVAPAAYPLDGLTFLVIGDGTGASGVIEEVTDLTGQVVGASGYFVIAEGTFTLGAADMVTDLNFENSDNVTHLLVQGFTGADGDDLDTNDDGVLDVTPWVQIVDLIALVEEDNPPTGTEYHYGPPSVGPDGTFVPGHAFLCTPDWVVGQFDIAAGDDTPGAANACIGPEPPAPVINEFSASTTGTDVEYVEVLGDASTDYSAYTILEVEGDSGTSLGFVDEVIAVGATDAAGFWLGNLAANTFENGTITLLLVKDFTGALGNDLDTNDDGVLDATPWSALVDAVAVHDGGSGDLTYGVPELGVSYDGLPFAPGGASRYPDGTDTDTTADWVRNDFDLAGIPGYTGTLVDGEALNTPGAPNQVFGAIEPVINEFSASTTGTDVEYVEVLGDASTDYSAYTILEVEGDSGTSLGFVDEVIAVGATDAAGFWLGNLAENTFENGTITLLLVKDFTGALGNDLDTNDDGVLDATPWSALVDAVAVHDGGTSDLTYGVPELGVSYDGLAFAPGGASRYPDGTDTDTTADWVRNDFDLAGIPGYTGTLVDGEALNTPGAPNAVWEPASEACGDPYTAIYTVQGNGLASSLVGTEVSVEGVVVGDFQNNGGADDGDLNGFHIQDPIGDADAATSDGIFISGAAALDVAAGARVRVRGTVVENYNLTQINVNEVWDCGAGAVVTPTAIALPVTNWDEYEPYEGMLVTLPQSLVISEYFNFDRYGEIVLTTDRQIQPTALYEPGSPEQAALAADHLLNRITLDDGRTSSNPDPAWHPNGAEFTMTNLFRGGDLLENVTGVLDYSYSLFRIQPTEPADYTLNNPRTPAPDAVGGSIEVASFNVLNYFTTIDTGAWICGPSGDMECRGADTPEELVRQRTKIISAMVAIDADIFGLIEIENHATNAPVADLVAGLNAELGAGTYAYIATGFIGTDAIQQALIYKPGTVTPVGAHAILDSSVDPTFIDTLNRPVLAQSFMDNSTNGIVTVAVNHLKSKGSACTGDPDLGDGAGNCNLTRTAAAQAMVTWLASDPTGSGDTDVLIIGDLNSYDKEDPIDALVAGGYTDLIYAFLGEYAYSYIFNGQVGYLDYALASADLLGEVTGTTVWHINGDEPDLIDYEMTFKQDAQDALFVGDAYRASDHDPVIVGLNLADETP